MRYLALIGNIPRRHWTAFLLSCGDHRWRAGDPPRDRGIDLFILVLIAHLSFPRCASTVIVEVFECRTLRLQHIGLDSWGWSAEIAFALLLLLSFPVAFSGSFHEETHYSMTSTSAVGGQPRLEIFGMIVNGQSITVQGKGMDVRQLLSTIVATRSILKP